MRKSQGRPVRYEFTEENINVIAAIAAEKGIEAYKEEHRKEEAERQSRVQNNAKALLTNYRRFKDYIENAEYDMDTTSDDSLKDMLSLMQGYFKDSDLKILSIEKGRAKTKMIMSHVDTMLDVYKKQCEIAADPEEMRRYRVIKGLYLDAEPKTAAEIAEEEHITERTVFRDVKAACKRLAILFFGIYGFRY